MIDIGGRVIDVWDMGCFLKDDIHCMFGVSDDSKMIAIDGRDIDVWDGVPKMAL